MKIRELTQSESILLKLVAKAINQDYKLDLSGYLNIDWNEVMDIAYSQGVVAIALDALNDASKERKPDSCILHRWIGRVCVMERSYLLHKMTIQSLADFYADNGFKMMLLKGYGLSMCWPVPEHRPVGDIDIYLGLADSDCTFGHKGVWKVADKVVCNKLGIEVDNTYHHHSVYVYKGTSVENHFDFINSYDHRSSRKMEFLFKRMVSESYVQLDECRNLCVPSDNFNALFLLKHCSGHFASTEVNIRQVLDWLLFVRKHHDSIEWEQLYEFYREYGLERLANIFSTIGVKYFGMQKEIFYGFEQDGRLVDRVIADILSPEFKEHEDGSIVSGLWIKPRRFWKNRWKHNLCYKDSWISGFIWTTYAKLLKPRHFRV